MTEIYFSNFQLEENTEYFLFVGELKNYGLNIFLKEALARIYNRKIDFIAVVPDVFEQYNYENLIVINPKTNAYNSQYGSNVSCRVSAQEFLTCVSQNRQIKALIKRLLNRQGNLFVYMYESLPEFTLDEIPGVFILGPEKHIAFRINSKTYQYENLSKSLPMPEYAVCRGFDALIRTTKVLWNQWKDGIFVSQEYSAAGTNSIVAYGANDIVQRFQDQDEDYIVSRYIPHEYDPTVLAVVAGEDDVYIAGIADQHIEEGTRFTGSTFPSVLSSSQIAELRAHTVVVGKWLAGEGYRGIFGCDFIVTADGKIFFLEINARKQGTTMEFTCTLEQSLPAGSPMLPELEFYAVTEGLFPANTVEIKSNLKNLHWGTYNFKIRTAVCTEGYLPQSTNEREAFKKVADGRLKKDFLIMEHTGCDFIIAEGSFIARIVALGHDPADVLQGLNQGRKTIQLTIAEQKTT